MKDRLAEQRPWGATTCEVCGGSGETDNPDPLRPPVLCWYCKGRGWYEAAP